MNEKQIDIDVDEVVLQFQKEEALLEKSFADITLDELKEVKTVMERRMASCNALAGRIRQMSMGLKNEKSEGEIQRLYDEHTALARVVDDYPMNIKIADGLIRKKESILTK